MWAPAFGGGQCGRKPPHNCGASPTPRAGLEAVLLPLGLGETSWDPLKWLPDKSCPQGLDTGRSLREGRGLSQTLPWGRCLPPTSHLPPGFTTRVLWLLDPGRHSSFLMVFPSPSGRILLPFQSQLRSPHSPKPSLMTPTTGLCPF